jgi:hypothetical protein
MDQFELFDPEENQDQEPAGTTETPEDTGPVPFGDSGIAFLCNVMQHALFLGVAVLILMIISYFGSRQ